MVRRSSRTLGRRVEKFAESYLRRHGLRSIARNYHCRFGEIDLIMQHGDCLVFVEVRFRSEARLSSARSSVDARKRRRLIRTAAMYLSSNPGYANKVMRFDVVGIDRDKGHVHRVHWVRDAFRPTDSSL